jgi:hypothetical protein
MESPFVSSARLVSTSQTSPPLSAWTVMLDDIKLTREVPSVRIVSVDIFRQWLQEPNVICARLDTFNHCHAPLIVPSALWDFTQNVKEETTA